MRVDQSIELIIATGSKKVLFPCTSSDELTSLRYCLFGDAMNTSSRMMSFGQEQNIHVSAAVKGLLPASYTVKERGKVTVKGKGEMVTYWVESKANRIPPSEADIQASLAALAAKKAGKEKEEETVEAAE